jgi:hypothetical protein
VSVEVKVLHAAEGYSSRDITKAKRDIRRVSVVGKEDGIARIRPKNLKS